MSRGADKRVFFLFSLVATMILVFLRGTAMAGASGSLELIYSSFDSKDTDATGLSTQTHGTSYFQRYNLGFSTQLYPQLSLQAGGTFDKTNSVAKTNDVETRSTIINILPQASLVFANPFVTGGGGFSRREARVESTGAPSQTEFQDTRNAFLLFRPEGLPTLNLQFTRSSRFDKERQTENTTSDDFSLNSAYEPVKNLSLSYTGTMDKTENKISETTSKSTQQSGRASYGKQFLQNRVSFSTDYLRARTTSETSSGRGALELPLFPFAGLSTVSIFNTSPPPSLMTVALSPNQPLIDGNRTASTGLNIGQSVSLPPSNDTKFREVGLDFVNPTEVNRLDVFVTLSQANQILPTGVADSFTWYIYTSPDNQNWTLYQAGLKAAFDPFSNRFEISFPNVTTRYIMAAVQPLSIAVIAPPGTDVSNIFIAELQGVITSPSTLTGSKSAQNSEFYDFNVRANLLKRPLLVYNLYYTHAKNDPGFSSYTLGNSLSVNQRLSRVLTGTARVAREDSGGTQPGGGSLSYLYSAALIANPLPTLSHSLVMSGSRVRAQGLTTDNNSVFLSNSARLYEGIDVNLTGGGSRSSSSSGNESESTIINAGASFVPHRDMTIALNYGTTESKTSSEGVEHAPIRTQNAGASVGYKPVSTVYLFYSITEFSATNTQRQTAQNYSASWSPLFSGTLQVFLSYAETVQQSGSEESFSRVRSAGASWRVGPRLFLSTAYSITKSETVSLTSESKSFSADLAWSF